MKERCRNEEHARYDDYGGRGITYCDEWEDFEPFLADMGIRPEGTSLDRIDPNGMYEPRNCRWATTKQQYNNRRSSVFLTVNGERKTYAEWEAATGISRSTIRNRMKLYGWTAEQAVLTPVDETRRRKAA